MVAVLTLITHVSASSVPFYWNFIQVEMDVQPNGDMWVTETQNYVFTANYTNERYRCIPLGMVDDITDVTATENGQQVAATTGTQDDQLWIRWQHSLNPPESRVFVLKYRVIGGLHVNGDKTQVYWKAIFADREAPVLSSAVTVRLPDVLSGQVLGYSTYGVPATSRTIDGTTFEFVANQTLQPGDELEVQVVFPSSILHLPQPQWQQVGSDEFDEFQFFLDAFPVLIGLLSPIFLVKMIIDRRCPRCGKFTLETLSKVLIYPTSRSNGTRRVIQHCNNRNCFYHREFEKTIFYSDDGGGGG
ncbi:MAG: DUF2207 domain-containing protein [Nodosilinea sp. WJT8-NPBG4]|nr:DUF2207 domain-containing protein [Nodosilinea sp. WJT8-NPBG4]